MRLNSYDTDTWTNSFSSANLALRCLVTSLEAQTRDKVIRECIQPGIEPISPHTLTNVVHTQLPQMVGVLSAVQPLIVYTSMLIYVYHVVLRIRMCSTLKEACTRIEQDAKNFSYPEFLTLIDILNYGPPFCLMTGSVIEVWGRQGGLTEQVNLAGICIYSRYQRYSLLHCGRIESIEMVQGVTGLEPIDCLPVHRACLHSCKHTPSLYRCLMPTAYISSYYRPQPSEMWHTHSPIDSRVTTQQDEQFPSHHTRHSY